MINTSELRIGNWVKEISFWQVIAIKQLTVMLEDGNVQRYQNIYPIPLTPEIWEGCGFLEGYGFWFKGGVEYNPKLHILEGFGHCEIKHLHQLQNLYFALTGEELEVKLPVVSSV